MSSDTRQIWQRALENYGILNKEVASYDDVLDAFRLRLSSSTLMERDHHNQNRE